jgi:hypothetical protein
MFVVVALFAYEAPITAGFIRQIAVLHESTFYAYGPDYGEGPVRAQMRRWLPARRCRRQPS